MKSKGMYAFFPPFLEQLNSIMAVLMDDNLRLLMQLDKNYIEKPEVFLAIFKKRMNEFMN
jgi:hypothetical protein